MCLYDRVTAGGHEGKVDEALVQKPEPDWLAVNNPHAMTDKRAAASAAATTDE